MVCCFESLETELRGNKSLVKEKKKKAIFVVSLTPILTVQQNSHPLMGYRNPIASLIGLDVVPDPDTSNSSVSKFYVPTFFERLF